jgi:hypothetical protein
LAVSRLAFGCRKNLHHRLAVDGRRLDVLDVVDRRREHPLELGGDPPFHLFRVEAGELPGDRDHRNVDVREDVGRRAQDEDRAGEQDQYGDDDEGVRTLQRDPDDPHVLSMRRGAPDVAARRQGLSDSAWRKE